MRILITGASGFVGRALTEHLMSKGHEVIGQSRRLQPNFPAECLTCDFADTPALREAFASVDYVIHAAGRKSGTRVNEFISDNADLPVQLYHLAQETHVSGFMQLSSATALLDIASQGQSQMPETKIANIKVPWAYARSKALAEKTLLEAAHKGSTCLQILRPCLIWGEQAFFHKRLKSGGFRRIGSGSHGHTTVHIDNLVDFVGHALGYEGPQQIFHPQDAEQLPFEVFLENLSTRLGTAMPPSVSPLVASVISGTLNIVRRAMRDTRDFGFQGVRALFGHEFTTNDALSRKALNWQPPLSVEAAMERIV